jgi:ribonuclease HI
MTIEIHTDGACSGNPGPGGWAATVLHDGSTRELSGGFERTTNNRMELYSVIEALASLYDTDDSAVVYSDSRYVVDMITKGHAERWKKDGWMRDRKHLAMNSDLWERLLLLCQERDIEFVWIKGHDGHADNERVDQLAVNACSGEDLPVDEGFINPPLFPSDGLFG